MKIIFMGTPDFSVGTLEALIEAGQAEGERQRNAAHTGESSGNEAWNPGVSAEEDQGS